MRVHQNSHSPVSLHRLTAFLHLRHRDSLEAAVHVFGRVAHFVQLVLAHVVDQAGADRVAKNVDGGSEPGGGKK